MKDLRKFLFGDLPTSVVVEEVAGGIVFMMLVTAILFLPFLLA